MFIRGILQIDCDVESPKQYKMYMGVDPIVELFHRADTIRNGCAGNWMSTHLDRARTWMTLRNKILYPEDNSDIRSPSLEKMCQVDIMIFFRFDKHSHLGISHRLM